MGWSTAGWSGPVGVQKPSTVRSNQRYSPADSPDPAAGDLDDPGFQGLCVDPEANLAPATSH